MSFIDYLTPYEFEVDSICFYLWHDCPKMMDNKVYTKSIYCEGRGGYRAVKVVEQ